MHTTRRPIIRFTTARSLLATGTLATLATLAACDSMADRPNLTAPDAPARSVGAAGTTGAVYTLSNDAASNAVVTYLRAADGSLTAGPIVPTGGRGLGAGLGSQGAIVRREAGDLLLAVNAGSDEISALRITGTTPALLVTTSSGGRQPISITVRNNVVYVLNAASNDIAGFRLATDPGHAPSLTPIAGSVHALSAPNAGGAQIQFTPAGDALIVTEKNTNRILSFPVSASGVAGAPTITASAGHTPFGFTFDGAGNGVLLVTEAEGGAPNGSTLSSYTVGPAGALTVVTAALPTQQSSVCWFATAKDPRFAFAANTGSASITNVRVGDGGALRLIAPDGHGATSAATPIDVAVTADGAFLYNLAAGAHQIVGFAIGAAGTLTPASALPGVPATAVGLVAK